MTPKDDCKGEHVLRPVIDRKKCEGKQDCVRVCPYGVFEMGVLNAEQKAALPLFPYRLKAMTHKTAERPAAHIAVAARSRRLPAQR